MAEMSEFMKELMDKFSKVDERACVFRPRTREELTDKERKQIEDFIFGASCREYASHEN